MHRQARHSTCLRPRPSVLCVTLLGGLCRASADVAWPSACLKGPVRPPAWMAERAVLYITALDQGSLAEDCAVMKAQRLEGRCADSEKSNVELLAILKSYQSHLRMQAVTGGENKPRRLHPFDA